MDPILRLHNVRKQFKGKTVLDVPDFSVTRHTVTGLAGPNGSGKSTLLKIISLVEPCSSGTVFFEKKAMLPFDKKARHLLCYLPQEPYLLKRSVFDNVAYGLTIRGIKDGLRSSVSSALALVGLPKHFVHRKWYELSGGEVQRVALAARLALQPTCLMLDEPTANVDMESAQRIRRAIAFARKEWGTTLIVSSHHQSWLNDICDNLVYLYGGKLLDHSYKNVLFGPWQRFKDELCAMKMTDGQLMFAHAPPYLKCSGVLSANALRITSSQPTKREQKITGLVKGISSNKKAGLFSVDIVCGDQQLVVNMPEVEAGKRNILPNQMVSLVYRPTDIVWLPDT